MNESDLQDRVRRAAPDPTGTTPLGAILGRAARRRRTDQVLIGAASACAAVAVMFLVAALVRPPATGGPVIGPAGAADAQPFPDGWQEVAVGNARLAVPPDVDVMSVGADEAVPCPNGNPNGDALYVHADLVRDPGFCLDIGSAHAALSVGRVTTSLVDVLPTPIMVNGFQGNSLDRPGGNVVQFPDLDFELRAEGEGAMELRNAVLSTVRDESGFVLGAGIEDPPAGFLEGPDIDANPPGRPPPDPLPEGWQIVATEDATLGVPGDWIIERVPADGPAPCTDIDRAGPVVYVHPGPILQADTCDGEDPVHTVLSIGTWQSMDIDGLSDDVLVGGYPGVRWRTVPGSADTIVVFVQQLDLHFVLQRPDLSPGLAEEILATVADADGFVFDATLDGDVTPPKGAPPPPPGEVVEVGGARLTVPPGAEISELAPTNNYCPADHRRGTAPVIVIRTTGGPPTPIVTSCTQPGLGAAQLLLEPLPKIELAIDAVPVEINGFVGYESAGQPGTIIPELSLRFTTTDAGLTPGFTDQVLDSLRDLSDLRRVRTSQITVGVKQPDDSLPADVAGLEPRVGPVLVDRGRLVHRFELVNDDKVGVTIRAAAMVAGVADGGDDARLVVTDGDCSASSDGRDVGVCDSLSREVVVAPGGSLLRTLTVTLPPDVRRSGEYRLLVEVDFQHLGQDRTDIIELVYRWNALE